jgi:ABC-type phosphate transport system substrate-binding protein
MNVRKIGAAVAATAAAGALVFTALAPAQADLFDGKPPTNALTAAGSDTIQWVTDDLSVIWNKTAEGQAHPIYNFDDCLTDEPGQPANSRTSFPCNYNQTSHPLNITLADGTSIARPHGSGGGRAALYDANAVGAPIAFGRSSGAIAATDNSEHNLVGVPFAVDTLVLAVNAGNKAAPKTLTPAQVVQIYTGQVTNWSQVGGKNGAIDVYMPAAGGTHDDWLGKALTAFQGAPVDTATVIAKTTYTRADGTSSGVLEHDPTPVVLDSRGIVPISLGRAGFAISAGQKIRIVPIQGADATSGMTIPTLVGGGYRRAMYYVLRNGDDGTNDSTGIVAQYQYGTDLMQSLFGPSGFVCTNAQAQSTISANGFLPMGASGDGQCGQGLPGAASVAALSAVTPFTPTVGGTAKKNKKTGKVVVTVRLKAGSGFPVLGGKVTLKAGSKKLGTVKVVNGVATKTLTKKQAKKVKSVSASFAAQPSLYTAKTAKIKVK